VSALVFFVVMALVVTASALWGADSRDGNDWRCPSCGHLHD
jgi:hypothetical protein